MADYLRSVMESFRILNTWGRTKLVRWCPPEKKENEQPGPTTGLEHVRINDFYGCYMVIPFLVGLEVIAFFMGIIVIDKFLLLISVDLELDCDS